MKFRTLLILLFGIIPLSFSQEKNEIIQQRIEFLAEQSQNENIDLTTNFELLHFYYEHPINLNNTSFEELEQLNLLTDIQITNLLLHIQLNGKLITLYELQTLTYWDIQTIQLILPFVTINQTSDQVNLRFSEILKYGHLELYNRFIQIPEAKSGFLSDTISNSEYKGNSSHYYTRVRYSYRNNLSVGMTADKDPGEEFFKGSNKYGFDFYSAHLYYNGGKYIKSAIIGDYQLNIGQGLAIWSSYAFGKTAETMNIKKSAHIFKPYTSVDENQFLRGGAINFNIKKINLSLFASSKRMDATIQLNPDSSQYYSSFQLTGLHRTTTEIDRKNVAIEKLIGTTISFKLRQLQLGISTSYQGYDKIYQKDFQPYNQFDFRGKEMMVNSFFYNWIYNNTLFFGEIAHSSFTNGFARLNGMLISLSSRFSLSVLYRNYDRNYQSLYSNGFSENTKTQNENGIYIGTKLKLSESLTCNSYLDLFSSPWLKYQVDAPSKGYDIFSQITFKPNKKTELYGRFHQQNHQKNDRNNSYPINQLIDNIQTNYRVNLTFNASENITLRTRIEYTTLDRQNTVLENGTLILQDFLYKPMKGSFDLILRYALFETTSYDTRIYCYEANALNVFSIPAYYDKGSKAYFLIKTTFFKHLDCWLRIGSTIYSNKSSIGTGLEKINGNVKHDFTLQFRFRF